MIPFVVSAFLLGFLYALVAVGVSIVLHDRPRFKRLVLCSTWPVAVGIVLATKYEDAKALLRNSKAFEVSK